MKYNAICFDLDGVIINSEPLHEMAFRETLHSYGLSLSNQNYKDYFAGKSDQQGFIDYLASRNTSIPLPELLAFKQRAYASLAPSKLSYYEGVPELIEALADTAPLALVTGSNSKETMLALHGRDLGKYFKAIVTADDTALSKPNPECYLLASSRLEGFIGQPACITVEDSPSGIQAAKQAGMYCVAITSTHAPSELQAADLIVGKLTIDIFSPLISP